MLAWPTSSMNKRKEGVLTGLSRALYGSPRAITVSQCHIRVGQRYFQSSKSSVTTSHSHVCNVTCHDAPNSCQASFCRKSIQIHDFLVSGFPAKSAMLDI